MEPKPDKIGTRMEVLVGEIQLKNVEQVLQTIIEFGDPRFVKPLGAIKILLTRGMNTLVSDLLTAETAVRLAHEEIARKDEELVRVNSFKELAEDNIRRLAADLVEEQRSFDERLASVKQERNIAQITVEEKNDALAKASQRIKNLEHLYAHDQACLDEYTLKLLKLNRRLDQIANWAKRRKLRLPKAPE
jgi:chromosome segregation ATPase